MYMQRGFTLFELALVVAITGIAVTITLPAYQDYHYRTQMARLLDRMTSDQRAVAAFQETHRRWPGSLNEISAGAQEVAPYLEDQPAVLQTPRALRYGVHLASGVSGELLVEARFMDDRLLGWACRPVDFTPGLARYLPDSCR